MILIKTILSNKYDPNDRNHRMIFDGYKRGNILIVNSYRSIFRSFFDNPSKKYFQKSESHGYVLIGHLDCKINDSIHIGFIPNIFCCYVDKNGQHLSVQQLIDMLMNKNAKNWKLIVFCVDVGTIVLGHR